MLMRMHEEHLRAAIELAYQNTLTGGRPFGAILVRDAEVLGRGVNLIAATNDPTTHAEMEAIRSACRQAQNPRLDGAVMYASGHPCPMCLAAMQLAGIERGFYAYSQQDAEPSGLSTEALYAEFRKTPAERCLPLIYEPVRVAGKEPYAAWAKHAR